MFEHYSPGRTINVAVGNCSIGHQDDVAERAGPCPNQTFTAVDPANLISPITITDHAVTRTILNKKEIRLGAAYFKQDQWARAEKEWMRALELDSDFLQAQTRLDRVRNNLKH